jgi:hypothetical protein
MNLRVASLEVDHRHGMPPEERFQIRQKVNEDQSFCDEVPPPFPDDASIPQSQASTLQKTSASFSPTVAAPSLPAPPVPAATGCADT